MTWIRLLSTAAIALLFPACGLLSYQKEALDLYFDAIDESKIMEIKPEEFKEGLPEERQEDLRRGLNSAKSSISVYPLFPLSHKLAIDLARYLDDKEEVNRLFENAVRLFPDAPDIRLGYIRFLTQQAGEPTKAMALLDEGMTRDPSSLSIRLAHAEALLSRGDAAEEAGRLLLDTLRINDLPSEAYSQAVFFAFILSVQNEAGTAETILRKSAASSESGVRQGTASALHQNLKDGVFSLYEMVMECPSAPPELESEYLRLLISLNKIDRAEERISEGFVDRAAVALERPGMPRVLEGYLLLAKGETQAAQEIFMTRLGEEPGATDALEGWVVLYQQYPEEVDPEPLARAIRTAYPEIKDPFLRMTFGKVYGQLMQQIRQTLPRK